MDNIKKILQEYFENGNEYSSHGHTIKQIGVFYVIDDDICDTADILYEIEKACNIETFNVIINDIYDKNPTNSC